MSDDIKLTDEELFNLTFNRSRHASAQKLGEFPRQIANAATDKAIKKMFDLIEGYGTWNGNEYDEYWGYLCIRF